MIADGELLEHAEVYGNLYGVPKSQVTDALADGNDVILKIDVQGADNIRAQIANAFYLFLAPPSIEELERRLTSRMTESESALARRLETARTEIDEAPKFDRIVVNHSGRIDDTVDEIMDAVAAEHARQGRVAVRL